MANKNIILHPIVDGVQDNTTNLYPQTTKANIVDLALNSYNYVSQKVLTPSDDDYTKLLADLQDRRDILVNGNKFVYYHHEDAYQSDPEEYTYCSLMPDDSGGILVESKYIQIGTNSITITATVTKRASETKANPTLAGTEAALAGLEVNGTKYKVNQPTTVVANPTLAGTEADLSGLQVGSTKYKVPSGGSYSAGDGISISNNAISVKSLPYTTTAPTAANLDGTLHVVVLTSEPGTVYNGYMYIIT